MSYINNPSETAGLFSVGVAPIMALATKRGEVFVAAQPLPASTSFVMYVAALFVFATLTVWMEGKIRLLCLGILLVFALALGGCIPQPASAFQWGF